jgi:hypothetical protein
MLAAMLRASRYAAVAALVVIAAMIAVLLWPRRDGRLDSGEVVVASDAPRVIDTPLGPATLAPGTRATVRASASPAAVYIEVEVGEVSLGSDVLRAGQRGAFGDRIARRRLGPQIRVRIVAIHDANLDAMLLPSGSAKTFVISRTVESAPDVRPGDQVTLTVSPDEHEVFVISR